MKRRYDAEAERERMRNQIIGLGERSLRKSYYPELKLRLEELERFRAALDQSRDAIFVVDTDDSTIVDLNHYGATLLGHPAAELLGRPLKEYLGAYWEAGRPTESCPREEGQPEAPAPEPTVIEGFGPQELALEVTRGNVEVGGRSYCVMIARDVTRRLRMEAAQKSLEERLNRTARLNAIGTLAGGIAHDFNNLLMGIAGRVSILQMDLEDDAEAMAELEGIEDIVERATELTRQLLGTARGGKFQVEKVDLVRLVRDSVTMFGRTHKELGINLNLPPEACLVEADRTQLDQVLLNLMVNAAQAMPDGGRLDISLQLVTFQQDDPGFGGEKAGHYWQLSVTDTGCGMSEDVRLRIFDPFFTTKAMGRGTGLGLASVHGIVTNHGGFVTVYSELDVGTSFHVYLPLAEGVEGARSTAPRASVEGHGRILLVDDEAMVLEVSRRMMARLGFEVVACASGEEALAALRNEGEGFRLVVLDMVMPDLGGRGVFEKIRETHPDLPVVLSSGYSMNGQAQTMLDEGCAGFLQKPFKMGELSHILSQVLGRE